MPEKVAVFIDGDYFMRGLASLGFRKCRLETFIKPMVANHRLLRVYYYDCPPYQSNPPTAEERGRFSRKERFFTALKRLPRFEVRLGYLRYRGTDAESGKLIFQQKGVDVYLATDLLNLSLNGKIDIAFLVAGDGDFKPAVETVKNAGVSVRLFCFNSGNSGYSPELWESCDERTVMTKRLLNSWEVNCSGD